MKLLVDMNLSARWVEILTASGIEAIHWSEIGLHNAPDSEIFAYARTHGLIVFTHDLDFSAILAQTSARKPSVIQIRHPKPRPEDFSATVARAVIENADLLMAGALLLIEPGRQRIRILPIKR